MLVKGKDGELPVQSPYVKIAKDALTALRGLLVELGMTPSSRVRVQTVKSPERPSESKWAGVL